MKFPLSEDANEYVRLCAELDALDRADRLHTEEAATLRGRVKLVWSVLRPSEQKILRVSRAEPPPKKVKKEKR